MPRRQRSAPSHSQSADNGAQPAAVVGRAGEGGRTVPLALAVPLAVAAGFAVAVLGTALHAQVWYVLGAGVPLGALGALLLAGCASVYMALWSRNLYMCALVGGVAYALVGVLATTSGAGQQLIFTGTADGPALGSAVAGSMWVLGLAGVTLAALMLSWWVLRTRARSLAPGPSH